MKLSKEKTVKSDAETICEKVSVTKFPFATTRDKNQAECLQLLRLIDTYLKQSTTLKNKLHVEKNLENPSNTVCHSLNRSLYAVQKEIKILEDRLTELLKGEEERQTWTLLKSTPGMGNKTTAELF